MLPPSPETPHTCSSPVKHIQSWWKTWLQEKPIKGNNKWKAITWSRFSTRHSTVGRYYSFHKLQVNGNPALSNFICTRFPTAQTVLRILSNKVCFLVKGCTVAFLSIVNVTFVCTRKTKKICYLFYYKINFIKAVWDQIWNLLVVFQCWIRRERWVYFPHPQSARCAACQEVVCRNKKKGLTGQDMRHLQSTYQWRFFQATFKIEQKGSPLPPTPWR